MFIFVVLSQLLCGFASAVSVNQLTPGKSVQGILDFAGRQYILPRGQWVTVYREARTGVRGRSSDSATIILVQTRDKQLTAMVRLVVEYSLIELDLGDQSLCDIERSGTTFQEKSRISVSTSECLRTTAFNGSPDDHVRGPWGHAKAWMQDNKIAAPALGMVAEYDFRTRQFSLQINPALNVTTDPIRLTAGGQINVPIQPFKISGGTGNVSIGFVNRAGDKANAPSGLTLNKDGGLSGRVPDNAKALEDLAVKVVDQGGGTVLKELAWVINPALAIKVTNAVVTAGGEIPAGLTPVAVTGGTGSARYALFESDGSTAAALPSSLSFNQVNGQMTGQVNVAQASEKNYVVKVTDQGGGAAEGRFKLTVNKPLQLSID